MAGNTLTNMYHAKQMVLWNEFMRLLAMWQCKKTERLKPASWQPVGGVGILPSSCHKIAMSQKYLRGAQQHTHLSTVQKTYVRHDELPCVPVPPSCSIFQSTNPGNSHNDQDPHPVTGLYQAKLPN